MSDGLTLTGIGSTGDRTTIILWIPEGPSALVRARMSDGSMFEKSGDDLYECLIRLRMELESRGVFLCCQGAKSNVFPSGMLRQMSNGRLAYAHSPGVPVADTDIVDIFSRNAMEY
jgi:hypothetical protein